MEIESDNEIDFDFNDTIDSILNKWSNSNRQEKIKQDFNDLKIKVKDRFDNFISFIRKLEQTYLNHINNIENEFLNHNNNIQIDIDKLIKYKEDVQNKNVQVENEFNETQIHNLKDKVCKLCDTKIDFQANTRNSIPFSYIGKFISNLSTYDNKKLNLIFNSDIINEDIEETNYKINTQCLFTKPYLICRSSNRFTGCVLIPEHKYARLINTECEFGLFSVANKNCLKLISLPDGRVLETFTQFRSQNGQIEYLKEPRGLCWNHEKKYLIVCDSGNNRVLFLFARFKKQLPYFELELELSYVMSEINEPLNDSKHRLYGFKDLAYPASVCCNLPNGELFISDTFNSRIIVLNGSTWCVDRIISGGLNKPFSVAVWRDKLIIADTYNHRVLITNSLNGDKESIIPNGKGEESDNSCSSDSDISEDDDVYEEINAHLSKKKKLSSISSSTTTISTSSEQSSTHSSLEQTPSRLNGSFKRPYGLYVDKNDRLFVLDWYETDTSSTDESMKLSGRLQTFDLENGFQLLNYSLANNKLLLPNSLLVLKSGSLVICNIRHLVLLTCDTQKRNFTKLKWNKKNSYSDDDDL